MKKLLALTIALLMAPAVLAGGYSGGGGSSLSGTSGQLPYFNSATTITTPAGSGTDSIKWDATNKYLGIANTTPQARIHLGNTSTSGTVGTGAAILGVQHSSQNIGTNATVMGGSAGACAAQGADSLVAGASCNATGTASQAFGLSSTAAGANSHIEGQNGATHASATASHVEGAACSTGSNGTSAHAEGNGCVANSPGGHAQGYQCTVTGDGSNFAGGSSCSSDGGAAFVHGISSQADGHCSAVFGNNASDGNFDGCFVATDDSGTACDATAANEFRIQFAGGAHIKDTPFYRDATVTTVNGSTAGTLKWYQPDRGTGYKKVVVVLNGFNDSGETITFSTAFANTPDYMSGAGVTAGALVPSSCTTTQFILPATAGAVSGVFIIEGI